MKQTNLVKDWRFSYPGSKPRPRYGYNSHGEWSTLGQIRDVEIERENSFPPVTQYLDDTPAIWICPTRRKALRYLALAEHRDHLNSTEPLTAEEKEQIHEISKIEILPNDVILTYDGNDGYLLLRPKGVKYAQTKL